MTNTQQPRDKPYESLPLRQHILYLRQLGQQTCKLLLLFIANRHITHTHLTHLHSNITYIVESMDNRAIDSSNIVTTHQRLCCTTGKRRAMNEVRTHNSDVTHLLPHI